MSLRGHRLLPSVLDDLAVTEPNRILYSVPLTKDPKDGFRDISAKIFARAVDRCAWYLEGILGRGQGHPTLTYMGPQDVVYGIVVLASVKTGYKLLLNSPRNTLDAHLSLFEKTQCETFLLPPNFPLPIIKQILEAREMRVVDIPGLQHWIRDEPVDVYPYPKTFAEARLDPFVVLHTSGSTGMPKPIVQRHANIAAVDSFACLPSLGLESAFPAICAGSRVYIAYPLFHSAGLYLLLSSIYIGSTIVLGPFPPSPETINEVHVHGNVQQSCLPPAPLVDLVKTPVYLDNLAGLDQITYGGGPLPKPVGDSIVSKTRLLNCVGSTECGSFPMLLCDPEDWEYLRFSRVVGNDFREVSDGLYEHFIVRQPEHEMYQGVFRNFPDLEEWPMKDLYQKHPTKDDLWLYKGRSDDIIVFSTGEKLNPVDMELAITANPLVSAALVTGVGHFQSSLLVEAVTPPTNDEEKRDLAATIWPSVEAANKKAPSHARIHRDMILFTVPEKPMPRAGKGTVQRQSTVKLYAEEIDALYQATSEAVNGSGNQNESANGISSSDLNLNMVLKIVAAATGIDVAQISKDRNLFELGLDSLQVLSITREINKMLSEYGVRREFEAKMIYADPSIAGLMRAVAGSIGGGNDVPAKSDRQQMQTLLDTYSQRIPISARNPEPHPLDAITVLLTGSTGSLGSYILDSLQRDTRIKQVFCLTRGRNGRQRQSESQLARELRPISDRVEIFDADLSRPRFGLELRVYRTLLSKVTLVIHNAWQVDFNKNLDSFASQVETVNRIAEFSIQSAYGAHVFFVSSISAVGGVTQSSPIPERVFDDLSTPQRSGYGQSKFLAERLLDAAAKEANVPATICRVGQIAGPTTKPGVWPKQEWLPSLVASSLFLGKLPKSLGQVDTIDWIPVNELGHIIVELATQRRVQNLPQNGAAVYHAVNPHTTSWPNLVPIFQKTLSRDQELKLVPLEDWVQALRESDFEASVASTLQNPALKLLGFFQSLISHSEESVSLDTSAAATASPSLAALEAVSGGHVRNWIEQWAF